jgi:hypothetical protein
VLFVDPASDLSRLDGLAEHLRVIYGDDVPGHWFEPQPNPNTHHDLAASTRANCLARLRHHSAASNPSREVISPASVPRSPKFAGLPWRAFEYFDEAWKERIARMAARLPDSARVIDVGCGKMWLHELRPDLDYVGVDYDSRGPGSVIADINAKQFPSLHADWMFVSGALEYVHDPDWLIAELCSRAPACVLSYCSVDTHGDVETRRDWGWVNHLSMSDLKARFANHGFVVIDEEMTPARNTILVLARNTDRNQ